MYFAGYENINCVSIVKEDLFIEPKGNLSVFNMYRVDVSYNSPATSTLNIEIKTGLSHIQFKCRKDISLVFFMHEQHSENTNIACYNNNKVEVAQLTDLVKTKKIMEINTVILEIELLDKAILDFVVKGAILKQAELIKQIVKNYKKKQSFFAKTLDYFWVLNNNWFLPNIKVFVREYKSNNIFEEKTCKTVSIYLKYIFSNRLSKNSLHKKVLKKLTVRAGLKFNHKKSIKAIDPFIKYFNVKMDDFVVPEKGFKSFNDFFTRKLKIGSRKVEKFDGVIAPTDCRIIAYKRLKDAQSLWIKGNRFTLYELLKNNITDCTIFVCRLAPQDYHRFHSPVNGTVKSITKIEGEFLSVHPHSVHITNVLTENMRVVIEMCTDFGILYFVGIGATLVGSIKLSVKVGDTLNIMDEIGWFEFGGSTVLLIFENQIEIEQSIFINSYMGIETLVELGNLLGIKK